MPKKPKPRILATTSRYLIESREAEKKLREDREKKRQAQFEKLST